MGFIHGYLFKSFIDPSTSITKRVVIARILKTNNTEHGLWVFKYPVKNLDVKAFSEEGYTKNYNVYTSNKKLFDTIEECKKENSLIVMKFVNSDPEIKSFAKIKKETLLDLIDVSKKKSN